jgi:adenosylcobinamide-GDP ribazoletransferase
MPRAIRAAAVTLTRLPLGGFPFSAEEWAWAPAHFPLVGGLLGIPLGVFCWLLAPLGGNAAAALTVGTSLLVTGAFHEDGLADTADAFGATTDPARTLEILKDSRIGSFGAAALVISIVTRIALLARLDSSVVWAIPLVGCVARVGPVWLLAQLPYVSAPATARYQHVAGASTQQAWMATGWAGIATILALLSGANLGRIVLLGLACALLTASCGQYFRRRLGGVTGDLLGATEQLNEVAALVILAWGS